MLHLLKQSFQRHVRFLKTAEKMMTHFAKD